MGFWLEQWKQIRGHAKWWLIESVFGGGVVATGYALLRATTIYWKTQVLVFVLSVVGFALVAFLRRISRGSSQPSKLTIHRAVWGDPKGTMLDVTHNVAALGRDGLVMDVVYTNPVLGDPTPLVRKKLEVEYSFGNEIYHGHAVKWEPGRGESALFILPQSPEVGELQAEVKELNAEIKRAEQRSRRYPRAIFTVQSVKPDPPTNKPHIFFQDKVRVILTNTSDKEVHVWTPLWESQEVHAQGSPPGSRLQLEGPTGWKNSDWGPEVNECLIPVGRTFICYIALLPPIGQSIEMRIQTRSHLGTAIFPLKIGGQLYEERINLT